MPETILVRIKGDEKDFVRATGKAGQATKKFGGGMKALKVGLIAAAAAMTAMIVITKKLMKSFTDYALKIDKINKVTGMSCEALQKWGYVALQEHGNFETLTKSFTILAQRVVDADQGLETYTREFRKMGIELRDQQGNLRDVNDIFMDMGDYAKTATNQTEAMGTMGKILGSRYVKDLLPILQLSREEIERLGDEAERLGIVLDEKTIRAAKAFDDKLTKLKERMRGLGLQIAEKLMPAFDRILDAIDESGPGLDGLVDSIATLAGTMANLVANQAGGFLSFLSDILWGFEQAAKGAQSLADIVSWMSGTGGQAVRETAEWWAKEQREITKLTESELQERVRIANREITKYQKAVTTGMYKVEEKYPVKGKEVGEWVSIAGSKLIGDFEAEIETWKRLLSLYRAAPARIGVAPPAPPGAPPEGVGKPAAEKVAKVSEEKLLSDALVNIYIQGLDERAEASQAAWEKEVERAAKAVEEIETRAKAWAENIQQVMGVLGNTFSGLWDTMFDPMFEKLDEAETRWGKFGASVVKDIANMLKQMLSKVLIQGLALAAIITLINAIAPGAGTFLMKFLGGMGEEAAGKASAAGGFGDILKGITGKQAGGRVERRPYLVGERGAELFVPQAPGEIISNASLARLASALRPAEAPAGALGSPVTFVMEGDSAEILAAIIRIYRQAPRQQQAAFGADVSEHSRDLVESV